MTARKQKNALAGCRPKPALEDRELISPEKAGELMHLFKMLANDTRLRLIHALTRSGKMCVKELADTMEMKPQAVSNQLQRLVDRGILVGARDGNNVHYRIIDPCIVGLLDLGLCLLEDTEARRRK